MSKDRFNSVRGRLAILVAALTFASLLAALALVVRAYHQENEAIARQLLSSARALAVGVDIHLRQYIRMLHALAATPELQRNDLAAFERMVRTIPLPGDVWISLADNEGHQLINTRLPAGAPVPSFTVEDDLATALKRGETYISNSKIGGLKHPILFVTIPVNGGTRMLGLACEPESFSHNLSLRRIVGDNLIAIVDRTGVIAARSRAPEKFVGEKASPSFWQIASAREEGVVKSVTLDGVPVLTAFKRSALSGWTVVRSAPRAEAYASARKLLLVSGLLSVLLLLTAMLLARWIGRGLVIGVNRLVHLASEIGRGASPRCTPTGLRETDYVAQALCAAGERLHSRERELRELNHSLEHRISTRTSQLMVANQELATTNRELAEFARVAAHDLREPLRSISGFSTSLSRDFTQELPPLARNYTERISAAAQRMHRLLESIAAYSQVSNAPRLTERVDLNQTLNDVRADLGARLTESGGQIVSGELATVTGDPRELHQLLLNLIANGLKFRRQNVAPIVKVETFDESKHIRLVVSDNGIGFDTNLVEQLFLPFQRLENARTYEGTGMGLAIVRRIAERHGGEVRAFSTPGGGSRFEVTLAKTAVAAPAMLQKEGNRLFGTAGSR